MSPVYKTTTDEIRRRIRFLSGGRDDDPVKCVIAHCLIIWIMLELKWKTMPVIPACLHPVSEHSSEAVLEEFPDWFVTPVGTSVRIALMNRV
jgi:hypothetical protein